MNERLKLSELNGLVKKAVGEAFTAPIWVIGEISELKTNRSGHCYLVLIEKDENEDVIVAQARATIWSYTFRMLRPYFESTTGQQLTEGIKVLVSVSVEFHELYGYSLNIRDIDPTYTLGDMARRRREIIARLQSEGVAEMNKELELPLVPQKIAIISSSTAAGYQDFIDQLSNNPAGYHFDLKLFPAIMQGNQAESSIIGALEQIYLYENFFDAVVIIRGGGSQADLSCFDNYNLAYYITQFPLPVITGIGHEKDDSIVDLVAHTRLKTPTAVAEFLISGVAQFDVHLDEIKNRFIGMVTELIAASKNDIEQITRVMAPITRERIAKVNSRLSQTIWKLDNSVKLFIQNQDYQIKRKEEILRHESRNFSQKQLRLLEKTTRALSGTLRPITIISHDQLTRKIQRSEFQVRRILSESRHYLDLSRQKAMLTDPNKILERGYSITTFNGRALKNADMVNPLSLIETRLYSGHIISEVKTIKKES
ncbi:MAG: exodeoxyribonuclease VII large subunit [Bacteroidia bacterium]|nr:exodeoxyribonuclease VII large subunit [Bacteroidia bacterium]